MIEKLAQHYIKAEPYYLPAANEIEIAETAYRHGLPLLLKGPTGCGKTRFMQFLAWKLDRPLITVSCHDDLSTADLVGRYLIKGNDTVWVDGPLAIAVRTGAICYLDEIVEARKDTTVVIHPLADDRRELPVEKTNEIITAPDEFMLAVSYNPGYQSVLKDLKQSTRQRFVSMHFDYPDPELETQIVAAEAKTEEHIAATLVKLANMTRGLKDAGLQEGASTRLLIHAAKFIGSGIPARQACQVAITETLTDEQELLESLGDMIDSVF